MSEERGNGECVVPGPEADWTIGIVDGLVCACDEPGPMWRCIEMYDIYEGLSGAGGSNG